MTNPLVPSTASIRSTLKIGSIPQCQLRFQLRHASNYTPHSRYAKVTRLDKLHRGQKAALRREKAASIQRADTITATTNSLSSIASIPNTFPFTIIRTPSAQLPVYESAKNGGNRQITTIRKLTGDLDNLATNLREVLKMPEFVVDQQGRKKATIVINKLTGHLVVRGWRGQEVKAWMAGLGF